MPAPKNNQLATVASIKGMLARDDIKTRFNDILGKKSSQFMASLVNVVAASPQLKASEPNSIMAAAFVAASFDLPIDSNLGFSAIVPFNKKTCINGQWVKQSLAQFQMTDDLIAKYNNGQGASVVRFPYGNSTDELLASIGRPSIMWDVDTLDWQTKNVQANISAVLDSVSPGDIILMHDIHETTVESCATIVPELINRGYELVTIHTLAAANGVDLAAGETYYGFHGGTTNE